MKQLNGYGYGRTRAGCARMTTRYAETTRAADTASPIDPVIEYHWVSGHVNGNTASRWNNTHPATAATRPT
jgi:hypothetical protein